MGGRARVLRGSLGVVVVFMVFILFLFIGVEANYEAKTIKGMISLPPNSRNLKWIGRERHADLNYVSKRRVPNGPDPIHNRRAGKYRQPPGRA